MIVEPRRNLLDGKAKIIQLDTSNSSISNREENWLRCLLFTNTNKAQTMNKNRKNTLDLYFSER
jgi:hypothetical protein